MMSGKVFLAHADEDRLFVSRLERAIRRRGLEVWSAPSRVRGGNQWHDEIGRALARCDWFFVVLSPAATRSHWVKSELLYVLDKERYRGRIVPIVYKKCDPEELSWRLPALQGVSFCDRRFNDALMELVAILTTATPRLRVAGSDLAGGAGQ